MYPASIDFAARSNARLIDQAADRALDRIRIDRTRDPGSIDPVNPVYINSVEQIHAVDRIAVGDSNQPRSALVTVDLLIAIIVARLRR